MALKTVDEIVDAIDAEIARRLELHGVRVTDMSEGLKKMWKADLRNRVIRRIHDNAFEAVTYNTLMLPAPTDAVPAASDKEGKLP